jgi:hypothetical protein
MLGDKETYWIGFELVKLPYYFVPHYAGALGYKNPNTASPSVCGTILHGDQEGSPLWWNSGKCYMPLIKGVFKSKRISHTEFMDYEYYAISSSGTWEYEHDDVPFCYFPSTQHERTSQAHCQILQETILIQKCVLNHPISHTNGTEWAIQLYQDCTLE